ncbi:hypothetical protein JAAARDRAFT_120201 [Jaapia argillacea MUCL 33604]|uniref:Protein byr4 n=1 Tax=Jaapia argillacea MUCL 33604 TaxID=933084 RepID=A0A067Q8T9_9AGAM|nr:hypothetical protein JAAARDRAFT_120201 [Jaapia argillacea MUCL 33604]
MINIPAPSLVLSREEWPDADFELPEGEPLHASDVEFDKDDDDEDMDWDNEMGLGKTGGAKAQAVIAGMAARTESRRGSSTMFTIRPPLSSSDENDDDDEGISTIKVSALPVFSAPSKPPPTTPIDEDIEADFALPSDLTQLSLRPLSLHHQSSKGSLEWGDRDQTSSSQSSDTYSTLGFADASPSSNYTSPSLPETETDEEDEDDSALDGLVIPTGLFESGQGGKHLARLLEMKKKLPVLDEHIKVESPDPEDDFEIGLVIDDDADFSPSRLLLNAHQQQSKRSAEVRTKTMPSRLPTNIRPPSRLRGDRAKSPTNPPVSSARQLAKLKLSPSPPLRPTPPRSQTSQALLPPPPPVPSPSSSFLAPKPGSLRVQKSQPGLKPASPPNSQPRKLTRKASLPSLSESLNQPKASGSGSAAASSRYDQPTAASRARTHNTAGRIHGLEVPPTRPCTPSSNPVALRLTMPTSSSRLKSRPAISSVFPPPTSMAIPPPVPPLPRSTSPLPPRPSSSSSTKSRRVSSPKDPALPPAKVLKRPKRQRTYGDGTELDNFDDLPTDRDKEVKYRVQPKGYGNRVPGGSYPSKSLEKDSSKGTMRRKRKGSGGSTEPAPTTATIVPTPGPGLRRTGRIEFPSKSPPPVQDVAIPRKKAASPIARRKPTLIRNLGGVAAPKVVGDMKWNPQSLRWEGNDQVLRDFEAVVGTSTRPALITHLTGSSIGSPVGSFATGARIVGNMIFDPQKMCWISTLAPEDDEPDVFADLADDEDDTDTWETKGGTIRASQQQQASAVSVPSSETSSSTASSRIETPSPARSRHRSMSESESDRGSRASMCVCDVDDSFVENCRIAEERHRGEMKGWKLPGQQPDYVFSEPDRSHLFDIRALATRRY